MSDNWTDNWGGINWNGYFARYQKARGGFYFGSNRLNFDCQLVLTEGEKAPILTWVDLDPAGKYSTKDIFARTSVQLNGEYNLFLGEESTLVGGVKGLAGMLGGGGDYGFPEVTRKRSITTNNKDFTKQVLGDLDFRNALLARKRDYVLIQPTPQGDGWHTVEVGDRSFEGGLGGSPWTEMPVVTYNQAAAMTPEEIAVVERAAQEYFNKEMDEFLDLLRAAARAVTVWRM